MGKTPEIIELSAIARFVPKSQILVGEARYSDPTSKEAIRRITNPMKYQGVARFQLGQRIDEVKEELSRLRKERSVATISRDFFKQQRGPLMEELIELEKKRRERR